MPVRYYRCTESESSAIPRQSCKIYTLNSWIHNALRLHSTLYNSIPAEASVLSYFITEKENGIGIILWDIYWNQLRANSTLYNSIPADELHLVKAPTLPERNGFSTLDALEEQEPLLQNIIK